MYHTFAAALEQAFQGRRPTAGEGNLGGLHELNTPQDPDHRHKALISRVCRGIERVRWLPHRLATYSSCATGPLARSRYHIQTLLPKAGMLYSIDWNPSVKFEAPCCCF